MDFDLPILGLVSHDRYLANLVAIFFFVAVTILASFLMRFLLTHTSVQLSRWTGLHWLDAFSKVATKRMHVLIFWATIMAVGLMIMAGVILHVVGFDVREHVQHWFSQLTQA